LFALRQSLAKFHYYQQMVVEVDQEIQGQLGSLGTATTVEPTVPKRTKASAHQRSRYEPKTFDLRGELYRIFGVDLTNVPGISAITAQTILCKIGTDVSRFRNASAFASWLGLCPENKISCGKVIYTKSRRVRRRVATALRMAANSLHHAKDYLGEFFRGIVVKAAS
jgi:transposase